MSVIESPFILDKACIVQVSDPLLIAKYKNILLVLR